MATVDTNEVLNRLLILHHRSLPQYLAYAPPWELENHPQALATLRGVVDLQQRMVDRLGRMLLDNGHPVDYGEFPMAFTGLHDLALDYLLKQVVDRQRREVAYIEKCVPLLSLAPYAQAVAQEALGEARGHLESLEELAASPA